MIKFINVSKSYNKHPALHDINFEIRQGEMVFLTGHSGAGKTTLLKLMMLMEPIQQGQIFINKQPILRLPKRHIPKLRRTMGMIFQDPKLIMNRTVFENVALPLYIANFRPREIGRRVRAALDKVGLLQKEKKHPVELSSGEKQRVGIARAVVNKPMLLLADEPTGNLDPNLSLDIMRLFEAFNQVGVTVIIATHDLAIIAQFYQRIISLKQGRIVSSGE